MISTIDRLNLRPAEKRLVVAAAVALFIVLNLLFVVNRFGEWGRVEKQIKAAHKRLNDYKVEVDKQPGYKRELDRLQKIGQAIPAEDQALDLSKTVTTQAQLSGVLVQNLVPSVRGTAGARTNIFFEEKSATISLNATEQQLVDFLYLLGSGDSLIRARNMNVSPDPTKMRLNSQMTLVASYQRKPAARSRAGGASKPAATAVPAAPSPSTGSPFKAPPKPVPPPRPASIRTNAPAGTNAPVAMPTLTPKPR